MAGREELWMPTRLCVSLRVGSKCFAVILPLTVSLACELPSNRRLESPRTQAGNRATCCQIDTRHCHSFLDRTIIPHPRHTSRKACVYNINVAHRANPYTPV